MFATNRGELPLRDESSMTNNSLVNVAVDFGPISSKLVEAKNNGHVSMNPPVIARLYDHNGRDGRVEITHLDYAGIQKDGRHGFLATSSDGGGFPMDVDAKYGLVSATIVNR